MTLRQGADKMGEPGPGLWDTAVNVGQPRLMQQVLRVEKEKPGTGWSFMESVKRENAEHSRIVTVKNGRGESAKLHARGAYLQWGEGLQRNLGLSLEKHCEDEAHTVRG